MVFDIIQISFPQTKLQKKRQISATWKVHILASILGGSPPFLTTLPFLQSSQPPPARYKYSKKTLPSQPLLQVPTTPVATPQQQASSTPHTPLHTTTTSHPHPSPFTYPHPHIRLNSIRCGLNLLFKHLGYGKTFSNTNVDVRLLSSSSTVKLYRSNTNPSVTSNSTVPEAAIGGEWEAVFLIMAGSGDDHPVPAPTTGRIRYFCYLVGSIIAEVLPDLAHDCCYSLRLGQISVLMAPRSSWARFEELLWAKKFLFCFSRVK